MDKAETLHINEALQEVIIEVLQERPELTSRDAQQVLRGEFRRRNIPCPPQSWLRAAGDEIAHGNLFVVSKKAVRHQLGYHPEQARRK
jgi:hypothetical protein